MMLPEDPSTESGRHNSVRDLAASISRAASKQTYFTIRLLADRSRVQDAYRAYAYFRWLDDRLDSGSASETERLSFLQRQSSLLDSGFRGAVMRAASIEEQMLVELLRSNGEAMSGLSTYLRNMMQVMAFDAHRRGRLVSADELATYTRWLAIAVTEAMHYFIGHDSPSPHDETRYLAVTAAHITHMLRDTHEDVQAGYYNIPREFLEAHKIGASEVSSEAYCLWVRRRVQLARTYFEAGKSYLARVSNPRCRLAGYAYASRFERVLALIEQDRYQLRAVYPERKSMGSRVRTLWTALAVAAGWGRGQTRPAQLPDQAREQR